MLDKAVANLREKHPDLVSTRATKNLLKIPTPKLTKAGRNTIVSNFSDICDAFVSFLSFIYYLYYILQTQEKH